MRTCRRGRHHKAIAPALSYPSVVSYGLLLLVLQPQIQVIGSTTIGLAAGTINLDCQIYLYLHHHV